MNEIIAERAHLTRHDRVLDAGCGVGGSSIFLAKTYGCTVTGISLVPDHIRSAQQNAQVGGVADQTEFRVMDYCATDFPDGSFDVVWAVESVCHAEKKEDFIHEAFRLLKSGGRLIVADFFATAQPQSPRDQRLLDKWLHGWSMAPLATPEEFSQSLHQAGFAQIRVTDDTLPVTPSSRRLFWYSLPGIPLGMMAEWLGLRTKIQTRNFLAARYQYRALQKKLWGYHMFVAHKT